MNNPALSAAGSGGVIPEVHDAEKDRQTVRGFTNDLIAAHRHVLGAMRRHPDEKSILEVPGASGAVQEVCVMLEANMKILESRVEALGGAGAAGHLKEALTTASGFLAGLYGQVRTETASRMLRDDVTAVHFLETCTAMLHATALALRDIETAKTVRALLRAFPPALLRLQPYVSSAVVNDLARESLVVDVVAADIAHREWRESWRHVG